MNFIGCRRQIVFSVHKFFVQAKHDLNDFLNNCRFYTSVNTRSTVMIRNRKWSTRSSMHDNFTIYDFTCERGRKKERGLNPSRMLLRDIPLKSSFARKEKIVSASCLNQSATNIARLLVNNSLLFPGIKGIMVT